MKIKQSTKTVYTTSDGQEFTDHQAALDYEFEISCPPGDTGINSTQQLRKWLMYNRNFVLDYIGTQYDPVADQQG